MSGSFTARKWKGGDGLTTELVPFNAALKNDEPVPCAKLFRSSLGKTRGVMRFDIEDLGLLALHAREAFMEAIGRVSLEVTPIDLKAGDAIEGLGEVVKVERLVGFDDGFIGTRVIVAEIAKSGTKVSFISEDDGAFKQLIDITRDRTDVD